MSDPERLELEADFGDVIDLLRQGKVEPPSEQPGAHVWNAIAEGLGDSVAPVEEPVLQDAGRTAVPPSARPRGAGNVVSLDSRRSLGRTFAIVTAVAAAVLLVAIPLGLALSGESGQRAELAALGGFGGVGAAELEDRTLVIDLEGLESLDDGSTYDLWLLDLDGDTPQDPRWIGKAQADGAFTIPEDVDLTEYTVVDVSIEPDDGDPAHSGDSILRGDLKEA